MPRKYPSLRHISVLLCVALLLAILVPVSASAFSFGRERGVRRPIFVQNLELSIDSFRNQKFGSEGIRRAIWNFRRHEDLFDQRSNEFKPEIAQKFGRRWTQLGKRLDLFDVDRSPPTSSVPEPSTAVLMMLGLTGLAAGSARRMRSRAIHR